MTGMLDGLYAGMGAAWWAIGFIAVLGGFVIVMLTLWALCVCLVEWYADKKEVKEDAVNDD